MLFSINQECRKKIENLEGLLEEERAENEKLRQESVSAEIISRNH